MTASKTFGTDSVDLSGEQNEEESHYRHLYLVVEHEEGNALPVTFEMLGEARRLMNDFNVRYSCQEKVVAVALGADIKKMCEELVFYGADAVIRVEDPSLRYPVNLVDTEIISEIATNSDVASKIAPEDSRQFKRPRFMFFSADNVGRHLSATVLAKLESGLASDINKLVIDDLEIRHEHKTKGQLLKYEKILEMYRPDFSGFLWTTILCLDNRNPSNRREYHPQACSIIPGVFPPLGRDPSRRGVIVEHHLNSKEGEKLVRILGRRAIKSSVDFDRRKVIVGLGRGIRDSPEQNIKMIVELAKELDAEIGVSLPISKRPYSVPEPLSSQYMSPDRVIGTSGRKISPALYVAVGVSGAMQHIAGMKDSGFVIAINPDDEAPIKNECDIFIKGRAEDVIPLLLAELKSQKALEVKK